MFKEGGGGRGEGGERRLIIPGLAATTHGLLSLRLGYFRQRRRDGGGGGEETIRKCSCLG